MKNKISIGIVTFRQRAHLIKDLIKQIRGYIPEEVDILLAVNGNNEEDMPNDYREDMLKLSLEYKNVFPIVCPEFKSLCKLWNTLVIFSKTEYNFILCDDVISQNPSVLKEIDEYITRSKSEFFTINNQFSHFVLTKTMLHNLGYFDERLSGFGEEDGDIIHRYIEVYGTRMPDIRINGLYNKGSYELRNEKIETHIDNKPRFNREFIMKKYAHDPNGIYGMSPIPVKKVMEDYQQYPYEMFVIKNKHNISKFDKIEFDEQY
jgi:hypothetical protein